MGGARPPGETWPQKYGFYLKNATTARIYKPDSVGPAVPVGAPNRLIIYLGEPSPTPSIDLPVPAVARKQRGDEQPRVRYIFGLSAPKVYPAPLVTQRAVVSYTPFSPLLSGRGA